jgi:hypothetical protein
MTITSDSRIERTDQCMLAETDEGLMLLSLSDGKFYSLQNTGRRIWELLEHKSFVADLVSALREEFEIDDATCTSEVIELLSALKKRGFVRISN